ncbi:MAG: DUF86 domain-containing protein [Dehalococcoidia bacterium]|nr:DUF86 domain-containing protein [Dehalococcoidia bacterium]
MSETRENSRDWRLYVQDMIGFAEKALSYVEGMSQANFLADERTYDAVLRNLELIGEAATHVPVDARQLQEAVEWGSIIGARNRIAHVYLGIDDNIIWDVLVNDLPVLVRELRAMLDSNP